jgi:hypothetical protein
MKKTYVLFISFLIIVFTSTAQVNTFNRQFLYNIDLGGVDFNALTQTYDKGYVFVRGTTDTIAGLAHRYLELIKVNREGDVSWTKRLFKGTQTTHAAFNTVTQNTQNGIVIGTSEYQADSAKIVLVSMDSTGNVIWSKKYPGALSSFVHKILPTADGGYFITGSTIDVNKLEYAYAFKTNATGQFMWGKKVLLGTDTLARFYTSVEIPGEGYIATGQSGRKALVVKFDYNGNVIWNKNMFNFSGRFYSIAKLSDGSLIIAGSNADSTQTYNPRLCLIKMDAQGNLLWQKGIQENTSTYYGSYAWDIKVLANDDVMFSGYVSDPIPSTLLGRLDLNGNLLWSMEYRFTFHTFNYIPCSMTLTTDNGIALYVLGGTFTNAKATFSSELLKLDAIGNVGCDGQFYNLQLKNLTHTTSSGLTISNCGKDTAYVPVFSNVNIHDTILCENILDHNVLGVEEHIKNTVELFQNHPNPSSGSTIIKYSLYKTVNDCALEIYDSNGGLIHQIELGNQFEGTHTIDLNLKLNTGVYFYSLIVEGMRITKSMLIDN